MKLIPFDVIDKLKMVYPGRMVSIEVTYADTRFNERETVYRLYIGTDSFYTTNGSMLRDFKSIKELITFCYCLVAGKLKEAQNEIHPNFDDIPNS